MAESERPAGSSSEPDPGPRLTDAEFGGFDLWIKSHGGDDSFVAILHAHGFQSILSLSEFDWCMHSA